MVAGRCPLYVFHVESCRVLTPGRGIRGDGQLLILVGQEFSNRGPPLFCSGRVHLFCNILLQRMLKT